MTDWRNMPKRQWEQCGQGDLGAIEFGLGAHTPTKLRLLPFVEARRILLKMKNVRP